MSDTKCDKGKPCGSACIEQKDRCLQLLADSSQTVLDAYSKALAKAKTPEEIARLNKAADALTKLKFDEKGKFITDKDATRQVLTREEAELLAKRKSILSEGQTSLIQAQANDMGEDGQWTIEEAETAYSLLPSASRNLLRKSGQAQDNGWYNPDKPTEQDEPGKPPTDKRGHAAMQMWLNQGGRDAYTLGSQVFAPSDMDIEHIVPLSKGGRDHPENWVLIRAGLNRLRGNTDLPDFAKKAEEYASLSPEEYKAKVLDKANAQLSKGAAAKELAKNFAGNGDDYAKADAKLKKYVAQGLELRTIGNRIGRAGGLDAPAEIRDAAAKYALDTDRQKAKEIFGKIQNEWNAMRDNKLGAVDASKNIAVHMKELGADFDAQAFSDKLLKVYGSKIKP